MGNDLKCCKNSTTDIGNAKNIDSMLVVHEKNMKTNESFNEKTLFLADQKFKDENTIERSKGSGTSFKLSDEEISFLKEKMIWKYSLFLVVVF